MILAFIGIGRVGLSLASNLQKHGHEIIVAHDNAHSQSVKSALGTNSSFSTMKLQKAIDNADIIFLATPFKHNQAILAPLSFHSKPLIDCTNPVGPGISHGLNSELSGAEMVQKWAPDALVVKSYTIYGFENLDNPSFPEYDVKPAMLIAGDNDESKAAVRTLNDDLGFETVDVGALSQALHLEHMTLMWVKMVRANGHNPHFTWAYLKR